MENIKDILEQGEKEFQKKFYDFCESDSGSIHWEILDWHKKEQHKLLQSIVEMVDEETWYRNNKAVTELENNVDYIRVDSLKAKLTSLNKTTNKV